MILSIVAGCVLLIIMWFFLYLFFPGIKGFFKFIIAGVTTLFLMKGLSLLLGLFSDFFVGSWFCWTAGILLGLIFLYVLIVARRSIRRLLLFISALVIGFYLSILIVRFFMQESSSFGDKDSKSSVVNNNETTLPDAALSTKTSPHPSTAPKKACSLPWGGSISAHYQTYAFNLRSDGVCDVEIRTCRDGVLDGSYSLASCPDHVGDDIEYHYRKNKKTETITVSSSQYIDLIPGVNGKQRYDLDGHRIALQTTIKPVTGIMVTPPQPVREVDNGTIHNCTAPRGESVSHGHFIKAYSHPQGYGSHLCVVELRFCRDGFLQGSFSYPQCSYMTTTQG